MIDRRLAVLVLVAASGCAGPEPVFPPVEPPIVWPSSGEPARFAYVGKIEGQKDLKRPRSFWQRIGAFLGGPPPQASLEGPMEIAVTGSGVLYVSDPDLHTVHRFDLKGREYRALSKAGGGRAFETPIGLALSGERILVSDRGLRTVTVLSPSGEPEATLGKGALDGPVGVAVGPVTGRIFVADVTAHQIKVFHGDGRKAFAIGARGDKPGEFNYPTHVACDADENFYVSDSLNSRVQVFNSHGRFLRTWGRKGDFPGDFSQPKGISVDRQGHVLVVDSHFENVQVFDSMGRLLIGFGEEGTDPGQFWLPVGIFTDPGDEVWVADQFNKRVQVFRFLGDHPLGVRP